MSRAGGTITAMRNALRLLCSFDLSVDAEKMMHCPTISGSGILTAIAMILACSVTPVLAQNAAKSFDGGHVYNVWFDGRDDVRDFPTNGFFPGDFAANPPGAAIGAAGLFGSTPTRSYPSEVVVGGSRRGRLWCAQRYPAYDPTSGTVRLYDGPRHPCQ
jgi:hypothetical protein